MVRRAMQLTDVEDAINSMLRTDYIPLTDNEKLGRLRHYYVDYMGYLSQILSESDQLIVGRRGTGKTTLLYRAFVECMCSWDPRQASLAKPRTLGLYLDLSKCQPLTEAEQDFNQFEHTFVSALCDALQEEMTRSWPALKSDPTLFQRLFNSAENKRATEVRELIRKLVSVLQTGIPRIAELAVPVAMKRTKRSRREKGLTLEHSGPSLTVGGHVGDDRELAFEEEMHIAVGTQLTIADILRLIGQIRQAAGMPCILLFVDEFSSLPESQQRRFTTLLKRIMGTHNGLFVKLCAITDNYTLGSGIILQRDLFELSLDLDAFVERSGSLNTAMNGLSTLTEQIISQRLKAYLGIEPKMLFDNPEQAWRELGRSAMGVPRTLGIVLKSAWGRARAAQRNKISRRDIEHGISAASKAYLNQLLGASRDGLAIPRFVSEMWDALITRALAERTKGEGDASHFMALVKNQERLKWLTMFFVIHLLTEGRTTKKEKITRNLYCFDYGICLENNLGFAGDKNVIRQQRFAYDEELAAFDRYFQDTEEKVYMCPMCKQAYNESDLVVAGKRLTFCPNDKSDLQEQILDKRRSYTEEEIKIVGAIRSAEQDDELVARDVADDVGCYVQKVAKFGAKLDREGLISRERAVHLNKHIYYKGNEAP
jgi:hypothetical protein